jgi:hypothetical protein
MNRSVSFLIILVLVIAVGVLGYMYYDTRQRHGLEIKVGQVENGYTGSTSTALSWHVV